MMQYLLTFGEGIMAFLSPCILPMLPVYLIYLGGEERSLRLHNTFFFVAGFSVVFTAMGAGASAIGAFLSSHQLLLSRVAGAVMVLLGLNYAGVLPFPTFKGSSSSFRHKPKGGLSSFLFGMAYTFGWAPCLGAFLGSALMLAATKPTLWQGVTLLATFSLGLGLPFILSAALFEKLSGVFTFFKKYAEPIKFVCGMILCIVGIAMVFNLLPYYFGLF